MMMMRMMIILITTLFRCQVLLLAGQRPANWGHHLYPLRWTETFHMTDTLKHRYVYEGLRFNVLIREDTKV